MPVEGFPPTLDKVMNDLLENGGLTSFKIAGNPKATTIVLRFGVMAGHRVASPVAESSDSQGSLRTPHPRLGKWSRKSESHLRRDQQRLQNFISTKSYATPLVRQSSCIPPTHYSLLNASDLDSGCVSNDNVLTFSHPNMSMLSTTDHNYPSMNMSTQTDPVSATTSSSSVKELTRSKSVQSDNESNKMYTQQLVDGSNTDSKSKEVNTQKRVDISHSDSKRSEVNTQQTMDVSHSVSCEVNTLLDLEEVVVSQTKMSTSVQKTRNLKDDKADDLENPVTEIDQVESAQQDSSQQKGQQSHLPEPPLSDDSSVDDSTYESSECGESDSEQDPATTTCTSDNTICPRDIYPDFEQFRKLHDNDAFHSYATDLPADIRTKLQDETRNTEWHKLIIDNFKGQRSIICKTDDIVVECDIKKCQMHRWFAIESASRSYELMRLRHLDEYDAINPDDVYKEAELAAICVTYVMKLLREIMI